MQTEFANLSFDQIRYSMVWEGASSVVNALQPTADDEVLVICSAGCNVLNMLLQPCKKVWAVDLNPMQIKLLELKVRVMNTFPYEVYSGLLGFEGRAGMARASQDVLQDLGAEDRAYWSSVFEQYPAGFLMAGRLEQYICQFYLTLSVRQRAQMDALFDAKTIAEQKEVFEQLQTTNFEAVFVEYFSRKQLSNGRDPALFKYTQETGGDRFFERLSKYLESHLLGDSFISRFFFYGPANMPQHLRPPCYQAANYERLKQQFHKLETVIGEAIDFLESEAGADVVKASLSNIFEYTSPAVFAETVSGLLQRPEMRFVYWNLLVDQGKSLQALPSYVPDRSRELSAQEDCFYFEALHVFDTAKVTVNC